MAPKCNSRDAGDSDVPKMSHKVLLLSEKAEVLGLLRKEKYHMLKLFRSMVRMNLLSVKL